MVKTGLRFVRRFRKAPRGGRKSASRGIFFAMPKRVNFYIDGFNLYHRLREFLDATGLDYRWLDYRALCKSLLGPGEILGEIYYFTAVADFRGKQSAARHRDFIQALKGRGVQVRLGVFKFGREKMTDVGIAAQMLADAYENRFESCFLLSSDTDFVPAILAVRQRAKKTVGLVIPPYQGEIVQRRRMTLLERCVSRSPRGAPMVVNLRFSQLNGLGLPPEIKRRDKTIRKPDAYADFQNGPPVRP